MQKNTPPQNEINWSYAIGAILAVASIWSSWQSETTAPTTALASASTTLIPNTSTVVERQQRKPTPLPTPQSFASISDLRTALARDLYCEVKSLLTRNSYDPADLLQLLAEVPRPADFAETNDSTDLLTDTRWLKGQFNTSPGHQQVEALAQAGFVQLPVSVNPDAAASKLQQLQRIDAANGATPYFLAVLESRKGTLANEEEIRLWIQSLSSRHFNLALENLSESVHQRGKTNQSYGLLSEKLQNRLPTANLTAGVSRILVLLATTSSDLPLYSLGWSSRHIFSKRFNNSDLGSNPFTTAQSESIYLASYQKLFPEEPLPDIGRENSRTAPAATDLDEPIPLCE